MVTDVDFLIVQKHAVHSLDGGISSLSSFVVHETITLGATLVISGDLAGQNVAESGEGIMQSLRRIFLIYQRHRWAQH